jgi:hypothetical protein
MVMMNEAPGLALIQNRYVEQHHGVKLAETRAG